MAALAPEILFHIGSFPITNTVTNTVLVDAVLILLAWYINKHASIIPSKFQSAMELIIEGFYNLIESVSKTHTMRIFPYVMTFFLFILISNWSGLLPIITAIEWVGHGGHHEGEHMIPLFRSASTDLNTTLALAFVSLVATHTMSITTFGIKSYLSRFFSLNPMAMYTGLLELISEFTKIISFSFRLFGNIFVGEVILATVSASTLFAFLLPVPIVMYEVFVGTIQATIFALLTMAFMALFTTAHNAEGH